MRNEKEVVSQNGMQSACGLRLFTNLQATFTADAAASAKSATTKEACM